MISVEGVTEIFIAGLAGVFVIEVAKISSSMMGPYSHQRMKRYRRMTYWIGFVILLFVSGFVTVLSIGTGPIELSIALQIGVNAPAIITAWGTALDRDTIKNTKGTTIKFNPTLRNKNVDSRSWFRKIIEDQAW